MKDVLEVKKTKQTHVIVDDNRRENGVSFPEKLQKARATLEKYPIPAELYIESFSKTERECGFSVVGTLREIDHDNLNFLLIEIKGLNEIDYKICASIDILKYLKIKHFEQRINVHIRPRVNSYNLFEYELIKIN